MGCGTSMNDNEVRSPNSNGQKQGQVKAQSVSSQFKINSTQIKQIKTQKTIHQQEPNNSLNIIKQQQNSSSVKLNARLFLFGQSKQQRKIVQFEALPTPHIQILLSRIHNPPPVKYQPPQIILQQSQQLTSSHLYISTSHPPYNYMFATFIRHNLIFLCGGVNFNFDNVSNQAFIYQIREDVNNYNTPQKSDKSNLNLGITFKKKRSIGNNLMGNKFDRLPLMKTRRYSHMGVYLKVGKLGYVYVLGGRTQNDNTTAKCQKYSVQENKWTQIASMNAPRSTGFSIVINKKIYVFGGYTSEGKRSKKIQRYNTNFDSWQIINIKLHKGIQTGIAFPCPSSNQILIVGGNVQFGSVKTAYRINFQNETYAWDSDLKKQRLLQKGIALLEDNTAYVLGGDFEDTIQKYSYKDKTWKLVSGLSYGQCVSPDQINAFTLAQQTIQINFQADPLTKNYETETSLSGDFKYIFGSDDYPCIYELNTTKWVLKKKNVPIALRLRCFMTACKIKQSKIFIGGGIDCYFQKPSRAAFIYYSGSNKAIQIAKMKQKKYAFTACCYNNQVFIFGGQDSKQGKVLSTAQKYNIASDKWIELPDMPKQRTFHKAILSPNNKILIFGGTDCLYQSVYQIDIFDPNTNKFSTFQKNFPFPCDIKFIQFTGKYKNSINKKQTKRQQQKAQQFEFLYIDENTIQKEQKRITNIQQSLKKQQESHPQSKPNCKNNIQEQKFNEYQMIVFGHNSYRKEDQCYTINICLDELYNVNYDEKNYKLYPFLLSFVLKSNKITKQDNNKAKNKGEENEYFMVSNKGIFKWDNNKKQESPQIVINQMHMLQMPLQKFSIA